MLSRRRLEICRLSPGGGLSLAVPDRRWPTLPSRRSVLMTDPRPHRPLHRRGFLQIGSLGAAGLALPQLLRADAASGRSSHKSVIFIYLVGGAPHQDMFDLKPHAPREIAGPWRPIATNVNGIQICEALPKLAQLTDQMVIVRSLVGSQN